MDKEQILSTIKNKLGNTSLSERSLTTYVYSNLPGEGIEADDAYFDKHVGILKSFQGQLSADVAQVVNAFKTKWAEEHPDTNTPPIPPATPNAELEELKKQFAEMKEALAAKDKQVQATTMRNTIALKASELNVSNKALWEDASQEVSIADNASIEDLTNATKQVYEAKLKRYMGNGAQPYGVTNTPPDPSVANEALDNYFSTKPGFEK